MQKLTIFLAACFLSLLMAAWVTASQIFFDDYQDQDSIPNVGTYVQLSGTNTVVDRAEGDYWLQNISGVVQASPTIAAGQIVGSYDFAIGTNGTINSVVASLHELNLRPIGMAVNIVWQTDGGISWYTTVPGGSGQYGESNFTWKRGNEYHIMWSIDAVADTVSFAINGSSILNNLNFGGDFSHLYGLAISNGSNTDTDPFFLDEVKMNDDISPLNANYLIVTPDFLFNSASQLAQYRKETGYDVYIVKLSEIASGTPTAAEIDSWIENYSRINPLLKFIVLVGDVSIMASFQFEYNNQTFYTDVMYGDDSSDGDYLPELVVGRIPVTTDNDLIDYLDKMRRFESNYAHRNTIVFFGNMPELTSAFDRDMTDAQSLGYDTIILESPSSSNLYTTLNDNSNDVAMVIYYGHGSWYGNGGLNQGNLVDWENYDFPVIYLSGGCSFNDNASASLSLGHALLFSEGRSAASIGATVDGGFGYAYNFINNIIFRSKTDNISTGEMFTFSINEHYNSLVGTGVDISIGSWVYYFTLRMTYNGDPGLKMHYTPTLSDMPVPDSQQSFTYAPSGGVTLSVNPSEAKPLGVGSCAAGGNRLSLRIGMRQYSDPVDIYLLIYAPSIDEKNVYFINSDLSLQPLSKGLASWRTSTKATIDDRLYGDIPTSAFPSGTYQVGILVTPSGSMETYHGWVTSFVIF